MTLALLRDYAYKKATGSESEAGRLLDQARREGQRSPTLAVALVRELIEQREMAAADRLIDGIDQADVGTYARALTTLASAHADSKNESRSKMLLSRLPDLLAAQDAFDAAILERRLGRQDRAHHLFERAGGLVLMDVRALHEFAQTKLQLTGRLAESLRPADQETRKRLLNEAIGYLERVTQMDAPPTRRAWAWFDLGRARRWQQAPRRDVIAAFEEAVALDPNEERFRAELEKERAGA